MLYTNGQISRTVYVDSKTSKKNPILDDGVIIGGLEAGTYDDLVWKDGKITKGQDDGVIYAILTGEGNDYSAPFERLRTSNPKVLHKDDHMVVLAAHPGDFVKVRLGRASEIVYKFMKGKVVGSDASHAEERFGTPLPFEVKTLVAVRSSWDWGSGSPSSRNPRSILAGGFRIFGAGSRTRSKR